MTLIYWLGLSTRLLRLLPADMTELTVFVMFHRLPGEYRVKIVETFTNVAAQDEMTTARVSSLRHLGTGVAYVITCPALEDIGASPKAEFVAWLRPQDMRTWRPPITIQSKASRATADALYRDLNTSFGPHPMAIIGLDLWNYLWGAVGAFGICSLRHVLGMT